LNDEHREGKKINCFECRHFFITHEPAHPYGCQAMGFKSREMPSSVVFQGSGDECLLVCPKETCRMKTGFSLLRQGKHAGERKGPGA